MLHSLTFVQAVRVASPAVQVPGVPEQVPPAPQSVVCVATLQVHAPLPTLALQAVALSPFLSDSATELAAVTNPLVEREWLTGDELTEAGEG